MSINLNPELIRQANNASMFDAGEVLAREAARVYAGLLPALAPKPEHNEAQRAYLMQCGEEWRTLVEEAYTDNLRRRASWVSPIVAGPANYPARQMNKRANAAMNAQAAWAAKFEAFHTSTVKRLAALETPEQAIEAYRRGSSDPIHKDDPLAREKLTARLNHLRDEQDIMKRTNAYYRKHGTCVGFDGLDEAAARKLDAQVKQAYSWDRQPYPPYHLTNNNANIKRIAERLKELDALQAQAAAPPTFGSGFRVVQNAEACRVQILFDDKPDETTRALLKTNGFRWAPSEKAWQRLLNQNGIRAARIVTKQLNGG